MAARLKEIYQKEVRKKIQSEFQIKNSMAVPKLEKIVLNMGIGEAITNMKVLDNAAQELSEIAGQKPVITKAKKSIASFKLREGAPIGTMVTLRAAARPRLPRRADALVRRPRKLHDRHPRSLHLPGDRRGQGGQVERDEHHHRHHGEK